MSKNGPEAYEKNGSRPPAPSCPGGRRHADLKAYLDGELASPRRWLLQRHLARCAACREEIQALKRLGEDMKDLDRAVPRPELRARILANLPPPPARRAPVPNTIGRAWPRLALGGALAAIGVAAVFAMTHLPGRTGHEPVAVTLPPNPHHNTAMRASQPTMGTNTMQGAQERLANKPALSRDPFNPDKLPKVIPPPPQKEAWSYPNETPEWPPRVSQGSPPLPKKPESAPIPDPLAVRGPVQLALVVKDTDTLYQHIQARLEKLGGRIVSLKSDEATPESVPDSKHTEPPTGPEAPAGRQHGNVLTLNVPAAHARALLKTLKQLGTVLPASAVPALPNKHTPLPRPIHSPFDAAAKGEPQPFPENDGATHKALPSKARLESPGRPYPESADKAKADGSVTIVLTLYRRLDPAH